jgi:hypothetical protein
MIVAFRRRWCAEQAVHVQPRGLDPNAQYQLTFASGRPEQALRGAELLRGVLIEIDDVPGHEVIRYTRQGRAPTSRPKESP